VNDDINVLALIKGKERYIFLYDDSQRAEALRMLGRHASNPELSFSWYDAAVLSQKIRQEERQRRSRLRTPQVTADAGRPGPKRHFATQIIVRARFPVHASPMIRDQCLPARKVTEIQ